MTMHLERCGRTGPGSLFQFEPGLEEKVAPTLQGVDKLVLVSYIVGVDTSGTLPLIDQLSATLHYLGGLPATDAIFGMYDMGV